MSNGPGTGGGYDPIVGAPPNMDADSMITISAGDAGASGAGGSKKVEPHKITIKSLRQYSYNTVTGEWSEVTAAPYPFKVTAELDKATLISAGDQYVLPCPINVEYVHPLPAKLVVIFVITDPAGKNATTGSYEVFRE